MKIMTISNTKIYHSSILKFYNNVPKENIYIKKKVIKKIPHLF